MSYASDDLTPLFAPKPEPSGVGYRQGVVREWNQATAENVIEVGGTALVNLPVLNTSDALLLAPGDVVGIITAGSSWAVLGRLTVPGTPAAASALAVVSSRIRAAAVNDVEGTISTTYTDLTTVGPQLTDVPISASGKALVIVSAELQQFTGDANQGGSASFTVSGATTVAADITNRLMISRTDDSGSNNLRIRSSSVHLVESLNAGLHTFTMVYRSEDGAPVQWLNRTLTVFAL